VIEIAGAIATVLVTALIAYGVHVYRPKIGYELECASGRFGVDDEEIIHVPGYPHQTIEAGTLKLTNPTRSDIENFEIVFEAPLKSTRVRVDYATSLAKNSINCHGDSEGLFVAIDTFPGKEEIVISYSEIGDRSLKFVSPKKCRGKFKLFSIERERRNTKSFFEGLFFSLLTMFAAVSAALVIGYFTSKL